MLSSKWLFNLFRFFFALFSPFWSVGAGQCFQQKKNLAKFTVVPEKVLMYEKKEEITKECFNSRRHTKNVDLLEFANGYQRLKNDLDDKFWVGID